MDIALLQYQPPRLARRRRRSLQFHHASVYVLTKWEHCNLRLLTRTLAEVETDPGPGSYAWYAENLVSKRAVHFEVTQASNGQSFNPLNSGFFYITNGTSIQTSTVSSAIGLATTTSGAGQTSTQTTAVAATGTTTPSSAQSQTNTNNSSALSIGLGVGLGVGLSLLIAAAVFIICRKRKRKSYPEDPRPEAQSLNKEAYAAPSELGHSSPYVSEADSSAWPPQKHHLGAQEAPTESARYEMGPR